MNKPSTIVLAISLSAATAFGQTSPDQTTSSASPPNGAQISGVPAEYVVKLVNGKDSPAEIPKHLPIRIYLTVFKSTAESFPSTEDHVNSIARSYGLSADQSAKMRETLLRMYEEDASKLTAYSKELCSPLFRPMHSAKSIGEFIDYLHAKEARIDLELIDLFEDQSKGMDEETTDKIRSWIETNTVPSIQHMEIDKVGLYTSHNITPSKFLTSYCNREPLPSN